MTSNRPTDENPRYLLCIEERCASSTPELQMEESVPAAVEKPALSMTPEDLMERIVDQANMETAWKNVKANHGAPGPDGVTLDEFFATFRHHWPEIRRQLLEGTYQPGPARRKSIPKPDGGARNLAIPNVIDRLIQQAILQVLTPIFDPGFSESSFGFRSKRSAHDAAKQVQSYIRAGYRQCVDMDLSKFFDRVQHDVLMARVSRKVGDKRLLALIGRYLRTGRDGRHRAAALDRRHDARRPSFATPGEYPTGRFRQRVGVARAPFCALRGRLSRIHQNERGRPACLRFDRAIPDAKTQADCQSTKEPYL
jgi:RNA-directed DNA polymerase